MCQQAVLNSPLSLNKKAKFKRQCVACRNHFFKTDLLRITKSSSLPSVITLEPPSALFGRSLYCCNTPICLPVLLKKQGKIVKQRLKTTILPTMLVVQLEQRLNVISTETEVKIVQT